MGYGATAQLVHRTYEPGTLTQIWTDMGTLWFLQLMTVEFAVMTLVAAFVDHSLPWTVYGLGAFLLNVGLLLMRAKGTV